MVSELPPNLKNLVDQRSLKWIFVGGKGGVGKTTTSCCLAVQLATSRRNVLVVSTDPAHNLSDAFGQKFSRSPTLTEGFTNLYCMEVDPAVEIDDTFTIPGQELTPSIKQFWKGITTNVPGIDELMSFGELMKHVSRLEFDVTVFDTAPTGHTLRLLALPGLLSQTLDKVMSLKDRFGGIFSSVTSMMGMAGGGMPNQDAILGKLDEMKSTIASVQKRMHSPDESTFVCVCIPEFLSLFETERLVQELTKVDIDTHNIVVNQVLFVEEGSTCSMCLARKRMQQKYLDQISDLYEDFHIVLTPLLNDEIRGAAKLRAFGELLMNKYNPSKPLPPVLATGCQ